jgi:perosamine synthetase
MQRLEAAGVETRETFIPANMQEIFIKQGWTAADACPKANAVAYTGFYLPSGAELTPQQLDRVAGEFASILGARA